MADESTGKIPSGVASAAQGIFSALKGSLGSEKLGGIAGTVGKYGEIASFLTGFLTDNTDTQKNVKGVAELAKGAQAFNAYIGGRASVPQTVGDMVQAVQEYRIFKDDVDKGDGVLWASTKALFISKFEGWVAKKVAGLVFSNETPLDKANDALKRERGTMEASAAPDSGVPRQGGQGAARTTA